MTSLRRALRYLKPYWPTALAGFLSLVLVAAANLISPQFIRLAIDGGIVGHDSSAILWACLGLLGVAALRGLFSFLQGYLAEKTSQGVAYDMRNDIYSKLQNLSFSYHDQAQTGQLMTRVTSDVDLVRQFIGQGFLQLIGAMLMLFGSLAVLLLMNWRLALAIMAIMPLLFLVIGRFIRTVQPQFRLVQAKLGMLNTILQENLAGVRVVKAFAREEHEKARFGRSNEELLDQNIKVTWATSTTFPLIFNFASLGTLIVIWYGGNQVIGGSLSLGELVAFNNYLGFLMFPIFMLGMIATMMTRSAASAQRVFEVLDAESEVQEKPGAATLPPVQGRVAFEEVNFRYVGAEHDALNRVSFVAEPGQTVAIVGTTGAGKSTIINLIPRFYDVRTGRVTVDGHDVRDVTLESLRSQIGMVLQDTVLFSGTIRENIAYGVPEATREQIEAVARVAQAHDFILEQSQGYGTRIGEGGVGLSGGQMQRIAIARALLLDPRILVLDDSTSSVDAETEYQIQRAMDGLLEGRTSFIIAQRISSVRNADQILVLDGSRVVAQGTHEELLASSPLYCEIVASQLRDDTRELVVSGTGGKGDGETGRRKTGPFPPSPRLPVPPSVSRPGREVR